MNLYVFLYVYYNLIKLDRQQKFWQTNESAQKFDHKGTNEDGNLDKKQKAGDQKVDARFTGIR